MRSCSREEAFGKIDTLVQLSDSPFQLIELGEPRLQCLRWNYIARPRARRTTGAGPIAGSTVRAPRG